MADATRLIGSDDLGGLIIQGTLATPRPVGTLVRNTGDGEIYASTNATVPTYTKITNTGGTLATGIVLAESNGNQTPYGTIAAAMAAASSGDEILLYPGTYSEVIDFTGKTNVGVAGVGDPRKVIIEGPDATTTRVTIPSGATNCGLKNMTVQCTSGTANPGILSTLTTGQIGTFREMIATGGDGSGPWLSHTGLGTVGIFTAGLNGLTATAAFSASAGTIAAESLRAGFCTLDDLLLITGTARFTGNVMLVNANVTATDLIDIRNTGFIDWSVITINGQATLTNGLHIHNDAVDVNIRAAELEANTWDILVEAGVTGAGGQVQLNGCELRKERISADVGWLAGLDVSALTFLDVGVQNDAAFRVDTEFAVGVPDRASESAFGEGDSTVTGMTVFSNDGAASWVDNTAAAASRTGSTFSLWQSTAAGELAYWIHPTRRFTGLKADGGGTAINTTGGTVVWEYWNGSAWTAFDIMATDADAPYDSRASVAFNITNTNEQIRFDMDSLTAANWQTTTVNGVAGYAVRARIATGPITTVPVLERTKLGTNRTEINSDGYREMFGDAESLRTFWLGTGESMSAPSGGANAPGNADITVSTNVSYRQAQSSYATGQDNRAGTQIEVPEGLDTSRPIVFDLMWTTDGVSTNAVRWDLYVTEVATGNVLNSTTIELPVITQSIAPGGVAQTVYQTLFSFYVPDLIPGDDIAFSLWRKGTIDTNPDVAIVLTMAMIGTMWAT
jgi:hypothetical protein